MLNLNEIHWIKLLAAISYYNLVGRCVFCQDYWYVLETCYKCGSRYYANHAYFRSAKYFKEYSLYQYGYTFTT